MQDLKITEYRNMERNMLCDISERKEKQHVERWQRR